MVNGDSVSIWTSNQSVIDMKLAGSIAAGTKPDKVKVERPFLGGGFGRRTDWDVALEAVALAKTMPGKPVKVVWSREDDIQQDMWRPLAAQRIEVGLDDKGNIVGWRHRIVAASYLARGIPPLFKQLGGKDPVSAVGGEFRYAVPAHQVDYVRAQSGFEVGAWRGIAAGYTKFAVETMLDEIAAARGVDPLDLRIEPAAASTRASIAVLHAVAEMANWKREAADGPCARHRLFRRARNPHGGGRRGLARRSRRAKSVCTTSGRQSIRAPSVQPKNVVAQMEGAIIFGLGAALKEQITLKNGEPQQSNFDSYPILRMSEIPPIDVKVISTDNPPTGIGEAGVPVVAPAIANAVAQLTGGKRLRQLPMSPDRVKTALRGA